MTAVSETGNIDKSHNEVMDESVPLNSTPVIEETAECQAFEGSTVSAHKPVTTSSNVSAGRKEKTNRSKSAKSRPTCLLCSKSFHTRYKLNEHHAVVHLDKRLFSCNVCQKTFGRADHLVRHVRNRVCIPRQHQQLLDLVDASSKPGNCNAVCNLMTFLCF